MKFQPISQDTVSMVQESMSAQHGVFITQDKNGRNLKEINLRVESNTLSFKNEEQEQDFKNILYSSSTNERKPSEEYIQVWIFFLSFYILFLGGSIIIEVINLTYYNENNIVLYIQLALLVALIVLGGILLSIYILNIHKRQYSSYVFMILMGLIQAYLVICDKDLLDNVFDYKPQSQLDHSLFIIGGLYLAQKAVFYNYKTICALNIWTVGIYFVTNILTKAEIQEILISSLILAFVCIIMSIFSYKQEKIMKAIFITRLSQEDSQMQMRVNANRNVRRQNRKVTNIDEGNDIGSQKLMEIIRKDKDTLTEVEKVVLKLQNIMLTINQTCDVIMASDVRQKLNKANEDLKSILITIIEKENLFDINMKEDLPKSISKEDRIYVTQQYQKPSIQTDELQQIVEQRKKKERTSTLMNVKKTTHIEKIEPYNIQQLSQLLRQAGNNWNFDVFFLSSITQNRSLSTCGIYLFQKVLLVHDVFQLNEQIYSKYFQELEQKYFDNPYHNRDHATDVTCSVLYFVMNSNLKVQLVNLDNFALVVASLGHDVQHKALNNRFLVNNEEDLAITYNDISVLENMHAATTFQEMKNPGTNILSTMSSQDKIYVRKLIIEMILETDMSRHFSLLGAFRTKAIDYSEEFSLEKIENKILVLKCAIKCADIGHSSKEWDLHYKWSSRVMEEFFNQGDIERSKGQPISMYCDKNTTEIPKSQAGFIDFICLPLFRAFNEYLKSPQIKQNVVDQLDKNFAEWNRMKKKRNKTLYSGPQPNSELKAKIKVYNKKQMDTIKSISNNQNGQNHFDLSARKADRRDSKDILQNQTTTVKSDNVNSQSPNLSRTDMFTQELNNIVQELDKQNGEEENQQGESFNEKPTQDSKFGDLHEGVLEQLLVEIDKQ